MRTPLHLPCDPCDFRDAMAQFPTGVAIVTTDGPAGKWGVTVSAICSVSDTPPTVLVCLNKNSRANARIRDNGALTINVLAAQQWQFGARFASKSEEAVREEFQLAHWINVPGASPVLRDAATWLAGTVTGKVDVASHTVFFATIEQLCAGHVLPTVYHRRGYAALHAP